MTFQNKVVDDLFVLASDHDKSREAPVDDMVSLLLSVEEEKFLPDALAWRLTDQAWRDFKPQVLRHREEERDFFNAFVQKIFKKYEDVEAFSWSQSQDHPGYYGSYFFSFDLLGLSINGNEMIPQVGLEEDYSYRKYIFLEAALIPSPPQALIKHIELSEQVTVDAAYLKARNSYSTLVKQPWDIFLVFLQSLHRAYHTNYFIDLFGWFSYVQIDRNGLNLKNVTWEPKNRMER